MRRRSEGSAAAAKVALPAKVTTEIAASKAVAAGPKSPNWIFSQMGQSCADVIYITTR